MSKDVFEWNAEVYHRQSDPQYELAMGLLDRIKLKGDETIIDAGCGSGRVTNKILEYLPKGHIIAVDQSRNMLEVARRVLSKYKDRATVIEDDLQTFCLPKSADGIFSNCAMHFIADHQKMFNNLKRTLRPKGWLCVLFGTVDPTSKWPLLKTIMDIVSKSKYKNAGLDPNHIFPTFFSSTLKDTKKELEHAGFINIEIEEFKEMMKFPRRDQENGLEMMMSQALMKVTDDNIRTQIIDDIRGAILKEGLPEGHEFEFLICQARVA